MKLGESGEAFFVEECTEGDLEELPHMATSPIPSSEMANFEDSIKYEILTDVQIDLTLLLYLCMRFFFFS